MSGEQIFWIVALLLFAAVGYAYGFIAGCTMATKTAVRHIRRNKREERDD